jgi:hypothetical protein
MESSVGSRRSSWIDRFLTAAEAAYRLRAQRREALTGGSYAPAAFDRAVLAERRALLAIGCWRSLDEPAGQDTAAEQGQLAEQSPQRAA